jgi:hypothetical protein
MENLIIEIVLMKICNKKSHCINFFLCQMLKTRVSIQLKPVLGYFLAWFQAIQLPSTQSQSPLALFLFAPKLCT